MKPSTPTLLADYFCYVQMGLCTDKRIVHKVRLLLNSGSTYSAHAIPWYVTLEIGLKNSELHSFLQSFHHFSPYLYYSQADRYETTRMNLTATVQYLSFKVLSWWGRFSNFSLLPIHYISSFLYSGILLFM